MRLRKKQNVESEENEYANYSLVKTRFLVHLFLVLTHFVVLIMAATYNNWPRYCVHNNWAFFVLVGLLISVVIISTSTLVTYIIFEDLNWVIMSCLLFFYGLMFTVCGALYIADDTSKCKKCEVPIMRVDRSFRSSKSKLPAFESARYKKLKVHTKNSSIISEMSRRMEMSVAYITFILGVLYLIMFSYYILRREKV